jgi:hypothetical protein
VKVSELSTVDPLTYWTSQYKKFLSVIVPSIDLQTGQEAVEVAVALIENCPEAGVTTATVRFSEKPLVVLTLLVIVYPVRLTGFPFWSTL